jgi:hypothetical protein
MRNTGTQTAARLPGLQESWLNVFECVDGLVKNGEQCHGEEKQQERDHGVYKW